MSRRSSASPEQEAPGSIDRKATTPFLLNFCYRKNAFHNLAEFPIPSSSNANPPLPPHLQIYTWMNCTLEELSLLLTSAIPDLISKPVAGTRLSFRLVFPDTSSRRGIGRLGDDGPGRYTSREIGSIVIADEKVDSNEVEFTGEDGHKTLADGRFVIGDLVDCAIFSPLSDGSAVPRPSRGGFMNGRGRGGANFSQGRGAIIPSGEWRRGERLPDGGGGFRGRGAPSRGGRY